MAKRIVIPLFVLVLACVVFTACSGKEFDWVVKIDGQSISPQLYLTAQMKSYIEAELRCEDVGTNIADCSIDGINAQDWIQTRTFEVLKAFVYVEKELERCNLQISEEEQAYLQSEAQLNWQNVGSVYEGNGIDLPTYTQYLTFLYKNQLLFNHIYGPGGEKEVLEKYLKQYIQENIRRIEGFQLVKLKDDGTSLSQQELEELKSMAALACEELNKGNGLETVAQTYMQKATQIQESNIVFENISDFLVNAYLTKDQAGFDQEFVNQVFSLKENESAWLDAGQYYLVYQVMPSYNTQEEYLQLKQTVMNILKSEEFDQYILQQSQGLQLEVNQRALAYYNCNKIKINY